MDSSVLQNLYGNLPWFPYRPVTQPRSGKLVCGIGINDSKFVVQPKVEGKQVKHPAYSMWASMLERCYKNSIICNPTYTGCIVDTEWLSFNNFALWFGTRIYHVGYELDKDIMFRNNKLYSKNTCLLIPKEVNSALTLNTAMRGATPLGVIEYKDRFRAQIHGKHLGLFDTEKEAHLTWQKAKIEQLQYYISVYKILELNKVIARIQDDIYNERITIYL